MALACNHNHQCHSQSCRQRGEDGQPGNNRQTVAACRVAACRQRRREAALAPTCSHRAKHAAHNHAGRAAAAGAGFSCLGWGFRAGAGRCFSRRARGQHPGGLEPRERVAGIHHAITAIAQLAPRPVPCGEERGVLFPLPVGQDLEGPQPSPITAPPHPRPQDSTGDVNNPALPTANPTTPATPTKYPTAPAP